MRKAVLAALFLALVQSAQAAELRVLSSNGTHATLEMFAAEFTKQTGTVVTFDVGSAAQIQRKITTGQPADVIVTGADVMDVLDKQGRLKPGMKKAAVRTSWGLAVRAGAPKPDISTVDQFRAVMLGAKSVIIRIDPPELPERPGNQRILDMLQRIGVADQIKSKLKVQVGGRVGGPVAAGEIEYGIQNTTELLRVKGVEVVGSLPEEIQTHDLFSVGVNAKSVEPKLAQDFAAYLTSAAAADIWRKGGLELAPH